MSRMYLAAVQRWFATRHNRIWRQGLARSGVVTMVTLCLLVLGLGVAYHEHMQGNIHKLKAKMGNEHEDVPVIKLGGQEAVSLMRTRMTGESTPEFLSATMLPGRGMNVLQITAYIPGKGEVNLLASPPIEAAAAALTGTGEDADGQRSLTMGGAFEVPWADGIWGAGTAGGNHASTTWRGHVLTLPATGAAGAAAGGLMLAQGATSTGTTSLPDGGQAQATFEATDFGKRWPSKTQVTVTMLLSRGTIELTVVALNSGDVAEPIGIGWRPRFAILDGNREQMRLHIPAERRVDVRNPETRAPTGSLVPVSGALSDLTLRDGAKLGSTELNECFVDLHQNLLDSGPVTELSDPANNYGLRLTVLSPTIKALHVVAPANGDYVSIEPQYNLPDPFGREWTNATDTGMVVLQPGQSTEWKIRLELYSLANAGPEM